MKFLIIRRPRINAAMTPSSKAIREHKERALSAVKEGLLECIYAVPGGGGSVAISNAESVEKLQETLASTPLFLYSEFEVRPLSDFASYMESIAAAFEKQGR